MAEASAAAAIFGVASAIALGAAQLVAAVADLVLGAALLAHELGLGEGQLDSARHKAFAFAVAADRRFLYRTCV